MKLVVGNQKCYMDNTKVQEFKSGIIDLESDNFVLCPSSVFFHEFKDTKVAIGSQNVSICDGGAATGELSCAQLKSIGISYCIVGHSERREMFNETIEDTNVKVKKLLENGIIPILCIGETKEEKEQGRAKDILLNELSGAFNDMESNFVNKVIIAYEPIWSIGTGLIPSNEDIEKIATYIQEFVK
jgi:triosephosphate isomerase